MFVCSSSEPSAHLVEVFVVDGFPHGLGQQEAVEPAVEAVDDAADHGSHPERFGDALGLFFAAFVDASAGEFDLGAEAARAELIERIVLDAHHRFDVTRIVQWRYCGDLLAVGHFGFPLRVSIRWEECKGTIDGCQGVY
jgi:hypothetical protein